MSPGEEGETPREEKAQEGHGSWFDLNNRPWERTLAGSKALKWGLSSTGLRQQNAVARKGSSPGWFKRAAG
jgi:hypothetical protein